jgi:uncharacterized protein DUF4239
MVDLVHGIPAWQLGIIVVGLSIVLSGLGLVTVHRLVPVDERRPHNDIAGYISNIAAFVYAVIIAFLVVAVWQQYGQAASTAQLEANSASDVFHQARGYPDPLRQTVRNAIRDYVDIVIDTEWALQQRGGVSERASKILDDLQLEMLNFQPADSRQQVVHSEQLHDLNSLMDQRRLRIFLGSSGLHPVIWSVILIGSALVVVFTYFMGTRSFRAHLAMTALLGAAIGLVIFLIVVLDYPYRGDIAVKPDAFKLVRAQIYRTHPQ